MDIDVQGVSDVMEWTRTKPTKDGYYWMIEDDSEDKIPSIVKVDIRFGDVYWCGSEIEEPIPDNAGWYGPLECPEIEKVNS